jgi:DNA-binding response OmpR family regulator
LLNYISMCILVVDDEENIRESLREMLTMAGYSVMTAADGREALEYIEKGDISLLLVDLSMPGMSGEELLRTLRKRKKALPALLITALAPFETSGLVSELGTGYLRKPVERDLLIGAIKTFIKAEGANGRKNAF